MTADAVTLEQFKRYVCTHAFDVFSGGKYKEILQKAVCKNDVWAKEMVRSRDAVEDVRREILTQLGEIDTDMHSGVFTAVTCALHSNLPPISPEQSQHRCIITNCIDAPVVNLVNCNFHTKKRVSGMLQKHLV
jgi:hypothetical protein